MGKRKASGTDTPARPTDAGGPAVPEKMRAKHDAIWALVERFCKDRLTDEYAATCRRALGVLARKRPSPLLNGTPAGWAAGVVRAIGRHNFLDDPEQTPHLKTADIDRGFGVSPATGAAKSKVVRELLKMSPMATEWTLPSKVADHPLAYMVAVNGLIMDVRKAPLQVRQEAVERGLVPPLPRPAPPVPHAGPPRLYTLDAFITRGPITERFSKKNPEITRTIQIRGDQTLADLHEALFAAFDREEEHMYEFQFGEGPMDPAGPRYVLSMAMGLDDGSGNPPAGSVEATTLDMLGLTVGRPFEYWFDFGDDWWHQIDVMAIADTVPAGTYPKVTGRVGASPPQYAEVDE